MAFKIEKPTVFSPSGIKDILQDFKAKSLNIPIYQRLYAWGAKEIVKLLDDIAAAGLSPSAKDYYIGNITLYFNKTTGSFDIIDGQQRLTTIWLLGLVLKLKGFDNWSSFLIRHDMSVLGFNARKGDTMFVSTVLSMVDLSNLSAIDQNDVNEMMVAAIKTIDGFLSLKEKSELQSFSEYTLNRVKMIAIYLPEGVDLNKYFEDMNNRGVQLESHHILKAWLLEEITDKALHKSYAQVWDAVSQMNQYVEYSLDGTIKENRTHLAGGAIPEIYFQRSADNDNEPTLKELIAEGTVFGYKADIQRYDDENISVRTGSVVNFSEFLLHVLKLFLEVEEKEKISLEDKNLLETFEPYRKKIDASAFIRYLFKCRLRYDEYIIRSLDTPEGNRWEIRVIKVDEDKDSYIRDKQFREAAQTQAMLNVSTTPSVWLTPVLQYVMDGNVSHPEFIDFLENIDKKYARRLLAGNNLESLLSEGTRTGRYWFYNLDYLLWKKWNNEKEHFSIAPIERPDDRVRAFQFRDSRSVEHIYPQHPEKETWLAKNRDEQLSRMKDRFGNLALISISSNSSYNNQLPGLKKIDFKNRCDKYGIESLKLAFAYYFDEWTEENMEIHEKQMLDVIREYHNLV